MRNVHQELIVLEGYSVLNVQQVILAIHLGLLNAFLAIQAFLFFFFIIFIYVC